MVQPFQYYMKTEVVFGPGRADKTAELVQKHGGHRVLVVYGGGSAVRSGLLDRICGQLKEAGLTYETFGGVQPNPRLEKQRTRLVYDPKTDHIEVEGEERKMYEIEPEHFVYCNSAELEAYKKML